MLRLGAIGAFLGSLVLATSAAAVCDDVENGIGVYFDDAYSQNCCECFHPFTPFQVYFVLNHCTLPTLAGFEMAWRMDPPDVPYFVLGLQMPGAVDWWDDHEWMIGYGVPRPVADPMLLVSAQMMFATAQQPSYGYYFQVGPTDPATIAGRAAIAGGDPLQILPLEFCNDWPQEGMEVTSDPDGWSVPGLGAIMYVEMCFGGVSVEAASWGTIKSLYE